MSTHASLIERHTDATQKLILSSAIELLEKLSVNQLTVRAVAKHAHISERTIFRYYASREEFLDAVAIALQDYLHIPAPPNSIEDLSGYARLLYQGFEEKAEFVKSSLHTELFERMRHGLGIERGQAIQSIIQAYAPDRSDRDRKIVAGQIRYYLSASTWHYYRFHYGFSLEETIAAADLAIRLALQEISGTAQ
ncbi:helix-turn-helix domain-containing protein [Synechococcus elongatus IITB4]|uniref:TetR/AcrR family transcriptional regulator n=1 Tax=Synechococcus elongatus TaxID=32046 RepID=UPI0030CEF150